MRTFILLCLFSLSACMSLPSPDLDRNKINGSDSVPPPAEGELRIWIPYAEQGDATLIQFPNGKSLLIDAGTPQSGRDLLLPFLRSLGIDHLEALLITHYDWDHLGGVATLLAGEDGLLGTGDDITLDVAYDRGGEPWDDSPGLGDYLGALDILGIPRETLEAGQRLLLDSNVKALCVTANGIVYHDSGDFLWMDLSPATFSGKENAASIGLLLEMEDFSYLTAGDLTGGANLNGFLSPDVETLLAESLGEVDVVHVNHHGSSSSSNETFVAATQPEAVFIQAGIDNRFGHPTFQVLQRWEDIGAEVYSTHEGEGFLLTTDGLDLKIGPIQNFLID